MAAVLVAREQAEREREEWKWKAETQDAAFVAASERADKAEAQRDRALAALRAIAERDNVRNDEGRPPIPVALDRWHECIEIAKAALRETEGP